MLATMTLWSRRRWYAAAASAIATVLVIAVPTAMIPTGVFGRAVPVTWWSWPVLLVSAVLSGLLFATYVREPGTDAAPEAMNRRGVLGGLLTYFAVGCPVCNKLALLLLGYAGALQWFAPVQPFLGVAALALMVWALRARLRGEVACPVAPAPAADPAELSTGR